ncbi:MAG: hypothetical protein HY711_03525 [Candidatus Melainabacteria bacterium]|nr:hypothetical protein [Candidatus Melainabacteria bacterium]
MFLCRKPREKTLRHSLGQASALAIALVAVLIILGLGYLGFVLIFGGAKELQNAVDSGTLGVATQSLVNPEIELTDALELRQFSALADKRDNKYYINLGNLNRIWGQALAVLVNVDEMANKNVAGPQANTNARKIYELATAISQKLTKKFQGEVPELQGVFTKLASQNPLRMIKGSITRLAWSTSFVDARRPSNVRVNPNQLPAGITLETDSRGYMLGYQNYQLKDGAGKTYIFDFVPLEYGRKPRVISQSSFDAGKNFAQNFPSLSDAIPPNAFSYTARLEGEEPGKALTAISAAAAKDVRAGFEISFPHGFVRIDNYKGIGGSTDSPGSGLHALDYASRQTTQQYADALNNSGTRIGSLLGSTMFNPIQVKCAQLKPWANNMGVELKWEQAIGWLENIGNNALEVLCSMPARRAVGCMAAGAAALLPIPNTMDLGGGITVGIPPQAKALLVIAFCAPRLFDDLRAPCLIRKRPCEYHFVFGHTPVVAQGLGDGWFYGPGETGVDPGYYTVTAQKANEHRLLFDIENGDQDTLRNMTYIAEFLRAPQAIGEWLGFMPQLNVDLGVFTAYFWAANNPSGADYSSKMLFRLNTNDESLVSGMRKRIEEDQLPSLLNAGGQKKYTEQLSSLRDVLLDRKSDASVSSIYDWLSRRIRQIKPSALNSELSAVLGDSNDLPLGASAVIFMDEESKRLQVSILSTGSWDYIAGAMPPAWLKAELESSSADSSAAFPDEQYLGTLQKNYYRLVDPRQDFSGADSNLPQSVSNDYPARVHNYDVYSLRPSSGYSGLLGVLELKSIIRKKCALSDRTTTNEWNLPEDCFTASPYTDRYGDVSSGDIGNFYQDVPGHTQNQPIYQLLAEIQKWLDQLGRWLASIGRSNV